MELRAEPYNRKVHGLWRRPRRTLGLPGSITEYILAKNLSFTPLDELPERATQSQLPDGRAAMYVPAAASLALAKEQLEDAGHVVPACETEGHLALVEFLQGTLF